MLKLVDLIKDGIFLAEGDQVVCRKSYGHFLKGDKYGVGRYDWIGVRGMEYLNTESGYDDLSHWELTSFAKRTHDNTKCPVPDWCHIRYYCVSDDNYYNSNADGIYWDVNWVDGDFWIPDYRALVEHYNEDYQGLSDDSKTEVSMNVPEKDDVRNNSSYEAAVKTLSHLGYTYNEGCELWKPPLGEKPDLEPKYYTKEMFDSGILPEKGMVCYYKSFGSDYTEATIRKVSFNNHTTSVYVYVKTLTGGKIILYLKEVVYPEIKTPESAAKELYYAHMNLDEEEYPYMWEQCSPEYKASWLTIAEETTNGCS